MESPADLEHVAEGLVPHWQGAGKGGPRSRAEVASGPPLAWTAAPHTRDMRSGRDGLLAPRAEVRGVDSAFTKAICGTLKSVSQISGPKRP